MEEEFNKDRFKQALREHESGDNPAALSGFNREGKRTSAKGLYQWLDSWDKLAQEKMGKPVSAMMPKDDSPEELARARKEQEEFFDIYFETSLKKDVEKLKKLDTKNKFSTLQLAGMAHFAGLTDAAKYVKSGQEGSATKEGINPGIEGFLKKLETRYYFSPPDPHPAQSKPFVLSLPKTASAPKPAATPSPSPSPSPTPKNLESTLASPTTKGPTPMPTPSKKLTEVTAEATTEPTKQEETDFSLAGPYTLEGLINRRSQLEQEMNSPSASPKDNTEKRVEYMKLTEQISSMQPDEEERSQGKRVAKDISKEETVRADNEFLRRLYEEEDIDYGSQIEPEKFPETIDQFNQRVDKMTKDVYNANLTSAERSTYLGALSSYEQGRKKLMEAYDKGVERTEMAQLIELFGKALTQLGAGWYGLKHGVDMSGLDFKLSDWSDSYSRLAKRLEIKLDDIDRQEKATRKDFEEKERKAEKAAEDVEKRETRGYYTERSDFETTENRRVIEFNRQLRERRRDLATGVIEYNRNMNRQAKEAKTEDSKQRQLRVNALNKELQLQEKQLAVLEDAQENYLKAFAAKDMDKMEFYLSKIPNLSPEQVTELSGRGMFNLQERDAIKTLFDNAKKATEVQRQLTEETRQKIIKQYDSSPAAEEEEATDIDAQLEAIRKRKQELLQGQ